MATCCDIDMMSDYLHFRSPHEKDVDSRKINCSSVLDAMCQFTGFEFSSIEYRNNIAANNNALISRNCFSILQKPAKRTHSHRFVCLSVCHSFATTFGAPKLLTRQQQTKTKLTEITKGKLSADEKLTPVTTRRHWGTPTVAPAAMTAHRPLSSAMRSSDDIDWPVHSLMLSFHDLQGLPLRRLPSIVP